MIVFVAAEVEELDPAFLWGLTGLANGDEDAVLEERSMWCMISAMIARGSP